MRMLDVVLNPAKPGAKPLKVNKKYPEDTLLVGLDVDQVRNQVETAFLPGEVIPGTLLSP